MSIQLRGGFLQCGYKFQGFLMLFLLDDQPI